MQNGDEALQHRQAPGDLTGGDVEVLEDPDEHALRLGPSRSRQLGDHGVDDPAPLQVAVECEDGDCFAVPGERAQLRAGERGSPQVPAAPVGPHQLGGGAPLHR